MAESKSATNENEISRNPYGQNIKTAAKMGSWSSFQGAAAQ